MKNNKYKNMIMTALCIAIGIVLPIFFHTIPNAGSIFLPMHIPILICGFICGWKYGLACGIITPLLSSMLTGMPPMGYLPVMLCELAIYGLVAGLMSSKIHVKNHYINIYISLITAMISGRIVMGILNSLIFRAGDYSFNIWVTAAFITSIPGIIIQIIFIPTIIFILEKAKLIEVR